jgi:NADPH-ferrihemoprotein reductase
MSADLSDFDASSISLLPQSKFAIFILSTYGEGDPSDNANQFWEWAKRLQGNPLASLRYAAFGLGNSDYRHYNRVVDVVDEALQRHGAERFIEVGRADDATGTTEEDFLTWKHQLFACLRTKFGFQEHEPKYEPGLIVTFDDSLEPIDCHNGEPIQAQTSGKSAESPIRAVQIKDSRELFTSETRNCLHIDLDLSATPELVYKTGDHLAINPINPAQEVDTLLHALGLAEKKNVPITIKALDPATKVMIPSPTTVHSLFKYYLEICAPVSREVARSLAEFAPSSQAKEFLKNLSSNKDVYTDYISRTHVNLGRLLQAATKQSDSEVWSELPLTFVLESLSRVHARYYSISSSSILSPRTASITALVSNTDLRGDTGSSVPGLTSNYLLANSNHLQKRAPASHHPSESTYDLAGPSESLRGGKLHAYLRRSTFKLPILASTPIIMVAAGSGFAPFRAFIAERERLLSIGREVGDMILFFGCRHPDEDYIYCDELQEMKAALGNKLQIVTAFSRAEKGRKVYVQDKVRDTKKDVLHLLNSEASLYICGRASMSREIGEVVRGLIREDRSLSDTQAQEWATNMKRTRKWQEDVWG